MSETVCSAACPYSHDASATWPVGQCYKMKSVVLEFNIVQYFD